MQCGCPKCGELMAQVRRGLKSHCACPICGHTCNLCMGRPIGEVLEKQDPQSLYAILQERAFMDDAIDDEDEYIPWSGENPED